MHSGNKHFTLVTDKEVDEKIAFVFDKVIVMKHDQAKNSEWKIENRWKAFNLSPYEQTLIIDTDIVICDDTFKYCF